MTTPKAENALENLWHYATNPVIPDWHALALAGIVMATMILLPQVTTRIPGSLVGIMIASPVAFFSGWDVAVIGDIPRTILLDNRLTLESIPWAHLSDLLPAAVSIAALGAIESLLCGTVGATMSGGEFDSNQELIGQGIGNLIIPFFDRRRRRRGEAHNRWMDAKQRASPHQPDGGGGSASKSGVSIRCRLP